ncbi:MAG: helix-turn-helix domain-containing protein [Microcystis aeruginosa]
MCSQYFTSSLVECQDLENTLRKSKKIRIYLTTEQRNRIRPWLGFSRYVFNKMVEYLQQPDTKARWLSIKMEIIQSLPEWSKTVPDQKSFGRYTLVQRFFELALLTDYYKC